MKHLAAVHSLATVLGHIPRNDDGSVGQPVEFKIYQSRATIPPDGNAHDDILRTCRKNNSKLGVTGFLYREGAWFFQYLEGDGDALRQLQNRIEKDERHTSIKWIAEGELEKRLFPDWQMGFVMADHFALNDLLEVEEDGLHLKVEDPMDVVVFLASNADRLRDSVAQAF